MDNINRENVALDLQVKGEDANGKKEKTPERRANVRFTEKEWTQIQNDMDVTGRSTPELLKHRYFKHPPFTTLMAPEMQQTVLMELRRIGNNFNQVAKVLNSGFREGWNNSLIQVRDDLAALRRYVAGVYGNH